MTLYPDTRIVTASMLTLSSVIVIAGFTYNVSNLEILTHGSIAITIDTGYCQVLKPDDTVRVYISDEDLEAWSNEVIAHLHPRRRAVVVRERKSQYESAF